MSSATAPATGFFSLLEAPDRKRVEELAEAVEFPFGYAILRQDDPADALYILLDGAARVVHQNADDSETQLAVLQPGDVLGEMALLAGDDGRRTATVRASSRVKALKLNHVAVKQLLRERPKVRQWLERCAQGRALFNFIRRTPALSKLPAAVVWELVESMVPLSAARQDVIYKEGEGADALYLLESGRARLQRVEAGKPARNIAFLRAGDFFGEDALDDAQRRYAQADAASECRLWRIPVAAFRKVLPYAEEFREELADRLKQAESGADVRVPLDFDLKNATVDQKQVKPDISETDADGEDPFATDDGLFKKRKVKGHFSHVRQVDEVDCGAACLAMICRHFGRKVSLAHIRRLARTDTDGTSLGNLCSAAQELGLAARTVKVSFRNLDKLPTPAILHWEGNHWVILVEVRKDKVRVADPASNVSWITREELRQKWNGYAGLFDYTTAFDSAPEEKPSIKWLFPFFKPYTGVLVKALLLALAGSGLTLLFPVLTQVVVDGVIVEGAKDTLSLVLFAMAGTFLFQAIASLLQGYLLAYVAVRMDSAALDFLTRRMLALPMSYFLSRRTGDLQRRLEGARQIRQMLVSSGTAALLAVVQFAVAISVMLIYSPMLTGAYFAVAPFYVGLMFFSARFLRPLFDRLEESQGRYRSDQLDSIKGIETVKATASESFFRQRVLERFHGASGEQFRADYTTLAYNSAVQSVGFLTMLLFLWLGAQLTMKGELSLGGFVAFNALVAMANGPVSSFLQLWDDLQLMGVLAARLSDVFEHEPEQGRDRSHLLPVRTLQGGIQLMNVTFRYGGPDSTPILKNVNLKLQPGETLAIVGRSGSGKTTLVKMLAGLLEPTQGAILFDGIDQKTLNYRDLRSRIGFVLQESHMFSGTISENIILGADLDMDRVVTSSRQANAHEFVERLPLGYETRIGETGVALSGGQRQRVAIARAIYRDPAVLIFDEATSALDTDSERAIQENLRSFFHNRTAIVIAHRLSTIRDADRIVVLEKGQVAEEGSHRELMERRGIYYYLVNRQLES